MEVSILDKIDEYRIVLESYSHLVLDLIDWKTTFDNNVEILNETVDYYRFFMHPNKLNFYLIVCSIRLTELFQKK